jgi:malate dehydrogenase (oxaloacetate-decarboxylating)
MTDNKGKTLASISMPWVGTVLRDPLRNLGTAFTPEQRQALGLTGLLPPAVLSLDEQAKRSYEQYVAQPDDLARKHLPRRSARPQRGPALPVARGAPQGDAARHLRPVVAQAIETYSHHFQRPNGVYLSVDDLDGVKTAFRNYGLGPDDVDLLVATDAGDPRHRRLGSRRDGHLHRSSPSTPPPPAWIRIG